MPIEYLRQLDDLSTCSIQEIENLVVQLFLQTEEEKNVRNKLMEDLREICKTKVERFLFWIKENNGESALFVKVWLQKFRELTEIDYEEILDAMRQQGEL